MVEKHEGNLNELIIDGSCPCSSIESVTPNLLSDFRSNYKIAKKSMAYQQWNVYNYRAIEHWKI